MPGAVDSTTLCGQMFQLCIRQLLMSKEQTLDKISITVGSFHTCHHPAVGLPTSRWDVIPGSLHLKYDNDIFRHFKIRTSPRFLKYYRNPYPYPSTKILFFPKTSNVTQPSSPSHWCSIFVSVLLEKMALWRVNSGIITDEVQSLPKPPSPCHTPKSSGTFQPTVGNPNPCTARAYVRTQLGEEELPDCEYFPVCFYCPELVN